MFLADLKHSWRRLSAHPGIVATAVLSLALGIGANSTIFSVIYTALLRPLPYPQADRLVMLHGVNLNSPNRNNRFGVTTLDFLDWREQSKTLEGSHIFTTRTPVVASGGAVPERINSQIFSPGLFEALGVRPLLGRLFHAGEGFGGNRTVVISEAYWKRSFAGSRDVIGKRLVIQDPVTIVGVIPSSFELFDEPGGVDIWWGAALDNPVWRQRRVPWLMATARLRPGVTIEQAQAEMTSIAARLERAYPETNRNRGVAVTPMLQARNGWMTQLLYPLFGAVAFVLLIACTNVANLLLARAAARRRELSVRAALGAQRRRLARELLADGVVLAVPGLFAGLALAYLGLALLRATLPPGYLGFARVEMSMPALFFTATAGLLAGLVAAAVPAIEGSRADLTEALKEGARGSAGGVRGKIRSLLVAAQMALAMVLLAGAGLMINTILRMQSQTLGFDPAGVLVSRLHIAGPRYMTMAPPRGIDMRYVEPPTTQFIDHVLREARALPGVQYAATGAIVPMGPADSPGSRFRIAGQSAEVPRSTLYNVISAGFFETLGIPLRRGRYITDRDTASSSWVAVVNEAFAREFFPNGEALGQTITIMAGPEERPREIVGIVADYRQFSPRVPPQSEIHTSYLQQPREIPGNFQGARFRPKLILRSPVLSTIKPEVISQIIRKFDPELLAFETRTLVEAAASRDSLLKFYARALGLFAAIAMVLAAVGIFGLMNYSVTDRFHEIGIRVTLGASRARLLRLVLASGLKVTAAGLAAGIAGALATTRIIENLLFGVTPWDPLTFTVVALFLLGVAMAACLLPAYRAMRVDPVVALRRE